MKWIKKQISEFGILGCLCILLFLLLTSVFWVPYFLLSWIFDCVLDFNDWSMTWFGNEVSENE